MGVGDTSHFQNRLIIDNRLSPHIENIVGQPAIEMANRLPTLGSRIGNTHTGLWGDVGCFSFYAVKHITTAGEGGILLTKDSLIADAVQRRRSFGQAKRYGDVPILGSNYRMTEVQAAVGVQQLIRLPNFIKARNVNAGRIMNALPELSITGGSYALRCDLPSAFEREDVLHRLKVLNVECSTYYPKPVPYFEYYRHKYGYRDGEFPNAEAICYNSITIPIGPHLERKHVAYMVQTLRDVLCELPSSEGLASSATI